MDSGITISIITGITTLAGVVISNRASNKEIQHNLDKNQAVFETKLDGLKEAVNKHNHFAEKMPVVEEQIKVINHRLEDLERGN